MSENLLISRVEVITCIEAGAKKLYNNFAYDEDALLLFLVNT